MGADMRYTWTGAPFVIGDVVVLGMSPVDEFANKEATRSDVRAYDVRTGKLRWTFHVIPQAGEFGVETWENDSWRYTGHSPVWSMFSRRPRARTRLHADHGADERHVRRPPARRQPVHQSIVAVEAATGKRVWHFQTVHHDLWDYDPPAAPILMDITVDGRPIKAVVQLTKQAFAFVLDRATGEPVWPIVERPVPQSNVPGERTSPTQPFPTKPPAFDLQGATEENLIDFTPELRAEALEILKRYTTGRCSRRRRSATTGPAASSARSSCRARSGGPSWTGGAVDPETDILYVPSATAPFVADFEPGDPAVTNLRYVKGKRLWGPAGPRGLPLFKPPYGRISAIDMNKGEILWQVANGDGPRDNPAIKHLNLAPLGNPGHSAPLVTKTLLFVGEGSDAMVGAGTHSARHAVRHGAELRRAVVPRLRQGHRRGARRDRAAGRHDGRADDLPARGKQYIVVAVGGRDAEPEWIALSLP